MLKFVGYIVSMGGLFVAIILLLALIMAVPVYFLWNWVAVDVAGLREITLAQAWGITVLCGLLFKTHGGGPK